MKLAFSASSLLPFIPLDRPGRCKRRRDGVIIRNKGKGSKPAQDAASVLSLPMLSSILTGLSRVQPSSFDVHVVT